MQVILRFSITWLCLFVLVLPVSATERPRPLGWAMDAVRAGNWEAAQRIAAKDGALSADIIEWHRLRAGLGYFDQVQSFLARRSDWPGEPYLRRQSEAGVVASGQAAVASFFAEHRPQTPVGALALAAHYESVGQTREAHTLVIDAWRRMAMSAEDQAAYLSRHGVILTPHHAARTDAMLWQGDLSDAARMRDLLPTGQRALLAARIALLRGARGVDAKIAAVPARLQDNPGLHHARFVWRAGKGRFQDAKDLLRDRSTSLERLGRPEAFANRRRALARDEMRDGNPAHAYALAANHYLTEGSNYADLEWLAGYIALRKLQDPGRALAHFKNHSAASSSPISRGRAGYWIGMAHLAMGNAAAADQAFADGAQYQTSFYGLLAAEAGGLAFDVAPSAAPRANWRETPLARAPLFQAGMLLQASGELSLAERFWTHLAEQLDPENAAHLGAAALATGKPHLAVMVGKRVAQRGLTLTAPYYALHPLRLQSLPMAPEMSLAIARRESEFDPNVQSGVGARGLMQVMPKTGRAVAQRLGRGGEHSTERMMRDPVYNAELGAAYLSTLAGQFDGNVVLMSAAYNAGPSRPEAWLQRFGDPRAAGGMDIVDWIEHIPFRETRNYVMRVTESLPVYRAQLGLTPLPQPFSAELRGSTLKAFAP